jgi:putative transposase
MVITMKITPLPPNYHYNPFVAPIYPNTQQQQLIAKTSGCCRYVYNILLKTHSAKYKVYETNLAQGIKSPKPKLSYPEFCRQVTVLRHTTRGQDNTYFLQEVSAVALQQSAKDLYDAFQNFFSGRAGYPKPKKRSRRQSFTLTISGFQMHDGDIHLGNIPGDIPVGYGRKNHIREMPSTPTLVTIVRKPTGEYHASFLCISKNKPTSGKRSVGLDLGLATPD